MTYKQAINYLFSSGFSDAQVSEIVRALNHEPSEDAISRQAVLSKIKEVCFSEEWTQFRVNNGSNGQRDFIIKFIESLPSVTQQPKTGHWIETAEEYYKAVNKYGGGVDENTPYFTDDIACSECLAKFNVIDNEAERFICCPNCGAKMEVEE